MPRSAGPCAPDRRLRARPWRVEQGPAIGGVRGGSFHAAGGPATFRWAPPRSRDPLPPNPVRADCGRLPRIHAALRAAAAPLVEFAVPRSRGLAEPHTPHPVLVLVLVLEASRNCRARARVMRWAHRLRNRPGYCGVRLEGEIVAWPRVTPVGGGSSSSAFTARISSSGLNGLARNGAPEMVTFRRPIGSGM